MQAVLIASSFISAALVLFPLPSYLRASNIAAAAIGVWLSIGNVIYAADALIWDTNVDIKVSEWCDISTSLLTGSQIALPAACLCICVHLERLASFTESSIFVTKQRRIIFDYLMCFALPVIYIALHLLLQPRRFDLYEGFGCRPTTFGSVLPVLLFWAHPLLLAIAAVSYAGAAWWHFLAYRMHFTRGDAKSSLTFEMYVRLIGLAVLQVLLSALMTVWEMWYTLSPGLVPLTEMSRNLGKISTWCSDTISWKMKTVLLVEWTSTIAQSALFFGLFAVRMDLLRHVTGRLQRVPAVLRYLLYGKWRGGKLDQSAVPTTAPVHGRISVTESSTLSFYSEPSHNCFDMTTLHCYRSSSHSPSPSAYHNSTVPSSHNSLSSSFDPGQLNENLAWPKLPVAIPLRKSRRASNLVYFEEYEDVAWWGLSRI